jgi:hypothetical protein
MAELPRLILQLPRDGEVERRLNAQPPPSLASGEVVAESGPTDEEGNLEASAAGQVVLSVPSPESLEREAAAVRRVIAQAGTGVDPLVVEVEAAEELREEELRVILEAADHTSRAVILRVVRDA